MKRTRLKQCIAILLSIVIMVAGLQLYPAQDVSAATSKVVTSIDVSSTVTSSKSILEQTKNDEYQVRDVICSFDDSSVNRATSEHFQIIWGNGDTTGTVNYDFIVGNLINLENIRTFYMEELGMKDIGISQNSNITGKYKTNVYVSGTGLSEFADDWAYMSVDADAFAYLFVAPGAMRVDEPSWVIPHELAHAFTYHQGGSIPYAWYEAVANWFRDQYLGSEYYAYGGNTYGPTSDFFAPYMINSSYHVPHMLNWYDTWPIFLYISENPDNIDGLGMDFMRKLFAYNIGEASMYDTIENLSGVSIKTILGGMSRRLATMDFSRQEHYLNRLNNEILTVSGNYEKIYTSLESADSDGWQSIPSDKAPMQTGFNIIPLDVDLSKDKISVEFVSTSSDSEADFRTSIVTSTAKNVTRYSNMVSGDGIAEIELNGDETKAYLVVCATPDTIETFNVDWSSSATDASTRFTYKVRVKASDGDVDNTPSYKDATITEGYYYIKNVNSGLYLDVAGGASTNGTNIQQWAYNGGNSQIFKIVPDGAGYYYILTCASDYESCVDVFDGLSTDGTNVEQWAYWGGDMQKYRIIEAPNGAVAFLTKASSCVGALDVYGISTENGANVNQWRYWEGAGQQWILETASERHAHKYSSSVTKQASCTATGVRTYTCLCGDSYTEAIAKTAHTYSSEYTVDVQATTTTEGSKSRHCTTSGCSAKTDVTVIPKVEVAEKLNGLVKVNGVWSYYVDGVVDTSYTGLAECNGAKWYVVNGSLSFRNTGLYKIGGSYYYIENGKWNESYTGLGKCNGATWYVVNGKISFRSTGLYKIAGSYYYIENGKWNESYTGLGRCNGATWYVVNGKISFRSTGLYKIAGSYYYIENGKWNESYTGLGECNGATWYVVDGKISFRTTGTVIVNGTAYTVIGGKLNK